MKKIILCFAGLMIACCAFGQDTLAVDDHARSFAIVSRMTRELQLDKKQQDQVHAVMQSRWEGLRKQRSLSKTVDRASINQKTLSALKKVLTKQQLELFMNLREENKKQKQAFLAQNPEYVFTEADKDLDF